MSRNDYNHELEKMKEDLKRSLRFIGPALGIIITISIIMSTFYTVEPDEEAVVIRLGRYYQTNPPGLHFKIPLGIDQVIKVKTRRVLQAEFGYRTSNVTARRTQYSDRNFQEESLMLTGDLNVADVQWAVQYQIADPFKFLFAASEPERNIRDISESIMRRVVGDRSVTEVLTIGRVEINNQAQTLMQEILDHYDMGINIVSVRLQDVNPPDRVKPSFNDVNAAMQEQERVINQAEESYNRIIPEARGRAEQLVSEAQGFASEVVNRALGDSERFEAVLVEYRRAPNVTRKRIYLETMEKIFTRFENLTVVDPKVQGLLPVYGSELTGRKPRQESAK
jgi:modulator of FtsH protease HflK